MFCWAWQGDGDIIKVAVEGDAVVVRTTHGSQVINFFLFVLRFLTSLPDVLGFRAEPISTMCLVKGSGVRSLFV